MTLEKNTSEKLQAILWGVGYCFLASIIIGMVRYVADDLHPTVILFFRNLFALIIFIPWLQKSKISALKTNRLKTHILRSVIGSAAMGLWFYSITVIPLTEAVALNFTAPLFGTAIAMVFLKEKSNLVRLLALITGFTGVIVILRPSVDVIHVSSILVLIASLLMAVSGILVKMLVKTDSSKATVFYFTVFAVPMSLLVALPYFQLPDTKHLLWLFAIAVSATMMQFSLSKALTKADVSMLTPLDFLRLVFTSILAFITFGEILDNYTIIGAIIIISSATFLTHKEVLAKAATS